MLKKFILVALSMSMLTALTACEQKGPAQKAGEKVDKAATKVKDAVDPRGPAEKAGAKVDKTLNQ